MAATQLACTGRARLKGCGGQGTRGAHSEHAVHVRHLGRVEAERLVERRRFLPSPKAGMRCGKTCGPRGVRALGGGDATGVHGEGQTQVQAQRGKGANTWCPCWLWFTSWNMPCMFVTLDVSKLSGWLNADASCAESKGGHAVWEEVRPGRRAGVGWRRRNIGMHGEGLTQGWGGQGTRGAHHEATSDSCP